jgi:hypothetical protein
MMTTNIRVPSEHPDGRERRVECAAMVISLLFEQTDGRGKNRGGFCDVDHDPAKCLRRQRSWYLYTSGPYQLIE